MKYQKPDHLFVGVDGCLYDTRKDGWHEKPLRKEYSKGKRHIKTVNDLKATLRNGEYAWPGGYQLGFITADGGLICFDCVKEELRNVIWSIQNRVNDGWLVDMVAVIEHDFDGHAVCCEHCGRDFDCFN
jgi:hypothetical protein